MSNKLINTAVVTFTTVARYMDYCAGCQEEGGSQISGVKRHRSLPLDTWQVGMTNTDYPDVEKEAVFCADCLESAHKHESINVIHNNEPLKRENSGMFFIGNAR
jgi:hypothetical protein